VLFAAMICFLRVSGKRIVGVSYIVQRPLSSSRHKGAEVVL
jgi:hypothetical protein